MLQNHITGQFIIADVVKL